VYRRKKFNARKETVRGENYLGIEIFRFFIKCPKCASEITFKTDPQNTDYVCEHVPLCIDMLIQGATRNYEPWRDQKFIEEELNAELAIEEEANPMKALENRTMESKKEMEILESLDDIRTVNAKSDRLNPDEVLERIVNERKKNSLIQKSADELQDEETARLIFNNSNGESIKRALDEEEIDLVLKLEAPSPSVFRSYFKKPSAPSTTSTLKLSVNLIQPVKAKVVSSALGALACYDSEDDSS